MYRGDGSMRQTGSRRERGATDGTDTGTGTAAGELLRRAVGYALGCAQFVTPALLHRPTPCAKWDLEALLAHADDSLAALHEGFDGGSIAVLPGPRPLPDDPAAAFRSRAARLLGAWTAAGPPHRLIAVADSPLTAEAVALTGALDLAVHGWDIARAVRQTDRPVPTGLAEALLPVSRHLVPYPEARPPLFAPEVPVGPESPPGDRLVAFLGRAPDW
ncbi:TIGR03086 family metal-binding protein [Streptomyces sp. NPDC048172]|uniref:TIGR03086 family metal-binding protein n=1 Tax=Streptomyces sp. NPDC048172 TaxID=3365505 RepID=UPI00371F7974